MKVSAQQAICTKQGITHSLIMRILFTFLKKGMWKSITIHNLHFRNDSSMEWITLILCTGASTIQMLPSNPWKGLSYTIYVPACEAGELKLKQEASYSKAEIPVQTKNRCKNIMSNNQKTF